MAYGKSTKTKKNKSTGDNNVDALLSNRRWKSKNVTFSFTSNFRNDYEEESGYPDSKVHNSSFRRLDFSQRVAARTWMNMYEEVSGLNLIELTGANDRNATMRIAASSDPKTAYARTPGSSVAAGDIWFRTNNVHNNSPRIGNLGWRRFGHEIGHALGLEHGHERSGVRNIAMNSNRDSHEFSIMTYRSHVGHNANGYTNEDWGHPQSLMMYDIRAIQQMYGANFKHNSNDTVYTFSTKTGQMFINGIGQGQPGDNRIFRTIWDGNGNDTYNFSNYKTNLSVDLRPGRWSDLHKGGNSQRAKLGAKQYARGHVFNALQFNGNTRSLIENAYGGAGRDFIRGNQTHNRLHGNSGNDTLYGYQGHDRLYGDHGHDTLYGGSGNDLLFGWYGNDKFYGGTGNDTIWADDGSDIAYGGSGDDTIWGETNHAGLYRKFKGGNDKLYGEAGNDNVHGGKGNDLVSGGTGNDKLYGDEGHDQLYGDNGNDTLHGGSGNDKLYGWYGNDRFYGGSGNDTIWADDGSDVVYGGSGNDTIWGETNHAGLYKQFKGGNDKLYGEAGNDKIHGGKGNDHLEGGIGNDKLYGDEGKDKLYGGSGNDILSGGSGKDFMDGGTGVDTVDYRYWNGGGTYNLAKGKASFTNQYTEEIRNFESIKTGAGRDIITGNTVANLIQAGSGNDSLYGVAGNDRLYGEGGNDYLSGGSGNDKLYGNSGNDSLDGGFGNDFLYGGTGNDSLYGDHRFGLRIFGGGNDYLSGGSGNDSLYGKGGHDRLYGGSGNDRLLGSSGNDLLVGGTGDDVLSGGTGADKFQFKSLREGTDRITDFARTQGDKLEILASGFGGGLVKGLLDAGQFVLGAASDANDRFLYNRSTGAVSFDIDGSGSRGAIQFATLSAGTTLTSNDIVVV